MNEEQYREAIPAYALGALDPEERRSLETHLAVCEDCRAELAAYQAVTLRLGLAVPRRDPPAGLRAALLARAARESAPKTEPVPWTRPAHASGPAPSAGPAPASGPASWREGIGRLFARPAFAVLSLLVIATLLISNLLLWQRLTRLEAERSAPPLLVELTGTQDAPQAGGVFVLRPGAQDGILIADGLPALPQDRQYQLWLIKDGQRANGGTFSVGPAGYAALQVNGPEPLSNYQSVGVTIEPYGGSPGPTGNKVLGGKL